MTREFFFTLLLSICSQYSYAQSPCSPTPEGDDRGCHGCGGNDNSAGPHQPHKTWDIPIIRAVDPNEIEGPAGIQSIRWVSVKDKLKYTVRFENDPEFATAAAQNVYIRVPVHPGINANSLKLIGFGFGKYSFTIPANSSVYTTQLNLKDSIGLNVNVSAGVDIVTNEVLWTFHSVDPVTNLPPADASAGFLPVNDTMKNDTMIGRGEGYVTFLLSPKQSLLTGDTVMEQAAIIFDINPPIATNTWVNTIDAFPPISHINGYTVSNDTIYFHWSGIDDPGGVGLKDYTIYVSENLGPYQPYKSYIFDTSDYFVGLTGNVYSFFTISRDSVDNVEPLKVIGDITVNPTPLPITWLYFTGIQKDKDALLHWAVAEKNSKNYIIERSLDGKIFSEIGILSAKGNAQSNNYDYVDPDIIRFNVTRLYYRLRQVLQDNTYTYSNVATINISQTHDEPIVTAYPNPFSQNITLRILNVVQSDETDYVVLHSLDGKMRYYRKLFIDRNTNVLLDDLPPLEQGIYLLKTVINKKQYIIKMVKQ